MAESSLGLYLHVPFCLRRCPYCDFYSTTNLDKHNDFIQRVIYAIGTAPARGRPVDTVYFGGGTPSLLGEGIPAILGEIERRFNLSPDAEITLEANPNTVSPALLALWREAGVNRLSLGLQAGDDEDLKILGRAHTLREGLSALDAAARAGFQNISADMMLATPGQTAEKALALADLLASLPLAHISAYLLKIEEGTPFARQNIAASCPGPDEAADIYLAVSQRLARRGFDHYEISNFARPGFQSRHNNRYWTLADYLGIGPAAHSYLDGRRFFFPSDLDGFLKADDPWALTVDDGPGGGWEEFLMLALRLKAGLPLSKAADYGQDPGLLIKKARPLVAGGLATLEEGVLALTPQGFLVSNTIIAALLDNEQ